MPIYFCKDGSNKRPQKKTLISPGVQLTLNEHTQEILLHLPIGRVLVFSVELRSILA